MVEQQSRFVVVESPTMLPGNDFITGSHIGPFIDTGVQVRPERRGHVYISVETIREMAEAAGVLKETRQSVVDRYEPMLQNEYDRARVDILKEIENDPVRLATAELLRAAGALAPRSAPLDAAGGDSDDDADERAADDAALEGDGPGREPGSDDVPGDPGDELAFRI